MPYFLGLMSGTSMDGVDAVRCAFDEQGHFLRVEAHARSDYPAETRRALLALQRAPENIALHQLARMENQVSDAFAAAARPLLGGEIEAVGAHGQTVFHDPQGAQSSLQLINPARLAQALEVPVVADFRRADIALGGQGAPLVPAFHHAVFARADEARAVVNLGGIANLTLLRRQHRTDITGWDIGPANALMDEWAEQHLGQPHDADGAWAAQGQVISELLPALLADDYFARPAPKSTGRDHFNLAWARRRDAQLDQRKAVDVQRSFLAVTVESIARAVQGSGIARLYVCGGGALNRFLMQCLAERLAPLPVASTAAAGLDPMQVEAAAFAWLASRRVLGQTGNLPAVTGARREAVLGGLYLP